MLTRLPQSGYATVGISLGVSYDAYSFCGSWHSLSKLVLIAIMIKGRHRGLPVAIDRAVQLPRQRLDQTPLQRTPTFHRVESNRRQDE